MKRLLLLSTNILLSFLLVPFISFGATTMSSPNALQSAAISNGGVYSLTAAGSPYNFTSGISISNPDVTINVDPGVVINLPTSGFLLMDGHINFNGSKDLPITINAKTNIIVFDTGYGWATTGQPSLDLKNININNCKYGILAANKAVVNIENITFNECVETSIYATDYSKTTIKNVKNTRTTATNSTFDGLIRMHVTAFVKQINPIEITITDTDFIQDGMHDVWLINQSPNNLESGSIKIKLNNNAFTGDVKDKVAIRYQGNPAPWSFDATNNYWGTEQGPYVTGSANKTNGPSVPANAVFVPFKTRDPATILECCSSVIFIPGIQGSRLYTKRDNGTEDQLWEANWKSDLTDLYMDTNGDSINTGVYTKDIISKTNIGTGISSNLSSLDKDIYKDTLNFLENQKSTNIIKSYTTYAYDWRLDIDEIVNNGTKTEDSSYSKLIDILRQQAAISDTGKVTIMAHSMGGLITKRFIQSLSPIDQALIDKVILIAVPQVGTPEGSGAVLNGLEFKDFYKNLAPQKYNRALAENMITAHLLSPSDKYFNVIGVSPIVFNNISNLIPQVSVYGNEVSKGEDLRNFLSGADGRQDAIFTDVLYPNISPSVVVDRAKELHDSLDNYDMPSSVKVFQIVGVGMPTTKQIEYITKTNPEGGQYVGYNIKKTFSGDGTVVKGSANYLAGENYYINLYKYNTDTQENHEHKDISSLAPVTEIVSSIIKNETVIKNDYMPNNPELFDSVKLFTIGMHSPVDIHLYDSTGRHTGPVYIDVNGEVVRFIEENIPNMSYNEYGDDKYITGLDDKNYTVKLDGYDTGIFTLDLQRYTGDIPTAYEVFKDLPTTDLLASNINLVPDIPIGNIILDTNGDNLPDINAKNDGTIIDLNEEPRECKEHKDKNKDKDKKEKKNKKDDEDKDEKCKKDKLDKNPKHEKDEHEKSKKWHDKDKLEKNYKYKSGH